MTNLKQRVEESINILKAAEGFIKRGQYYVNIPVIAITQLQELIKELTEREAKLVSALKFYADGYEVISHENNGKFYDVIEAMDDVLFDEGKTAKIILKELGIE